MKETAIYIHVPFCDHKCIYCDFYSIITKNNINPFLAALKNEIQFYSTRYSEDRIITSIYFGGGTPSLMEPTYLKEIICHVKSNFNVSSDAEITIETNPGTVNKRKLNSFLEAGVNRISVGIQSFNNEDLKFLTRIHTAEIASKTVYDAKETGFKNINVDLIFNLPKQTKEKWKFNLETAVKLPVNHISAYSLILEKGTILYKMVLDGKVKIQNEDYDAELYEMTIDFLTDNGFKQYEVSNFSKPGFECIHNKAYWHYKDYFGFGTSAHSFIEGKRWWNFSSLKQYISEIGKKDFAIAGNEILDEYEMLDEYIMLALRSDGLDLSKLKNKFDDIWLNQHRRILSELIKYHFAELTDNVISLTKKGYSVCDEILAKIL